MNPSAEQIQKINHFSKVHIDMCAKIASVVEIEECGPKKHLLTEGDTGDTMVLVFQGQVEVSKNMMVKTSAGFTMSTKSIISFLSISEKSPSGPISTHIGSLIFFDKIFFKLFFSQFISQKIKYPFFGN